MKTGGKSSFKASGSLNCCLTLNNECTPYIYYWMQFQNHSFITFSNARCIYMYVYSKDLHIDVLQERKMNQQWNPIYEFLDILVEVFNLVGCDATSWVVGSQHFEKMQSVLLKLFDPCIMFSQNFGSQKHSDMASHPRSSKTSKTLIF